MVILIFLKVNKMLSISDLQFHSFTGFINLRFKKSILYATLILRIICITVSLTASFVNPNETEECSFFRTLAMEYIVYEFMCMLSTISQLIIPNYNRSRANFCTLIYYLFALFDCIASFIRPSSCSKNSFIYIIFILITIRLSMVIIRHVLYHFLMRYNLSLLIRILSKMSENHQHYESIQQLPVRLATLDDNTETCSICINNYIVDEGIKILPCNHFFHTDCIDSWFQISNGQTCPLCRSVAIGVPNVV